MIYHGMGGAVTVWRPVLDAEGNPVNTGPSISYRVGEASEWRLRLAQEQADATAMGDEFRRVIGLLAGWELEISLFWDIGTASSYQGELLSPLTLLSGALVEQGLLGVGLWVRSEGDGDRLAFYGTAASVEADNVQDMGDVVRMRVRMVGVGRAYFAAGLYQDGAFGAWEMRTFGALEGYTHGQLQTLPD